MSGGSGIHFVSGGAGFIGSHLVDRLLARGQRVVAIDDLSGGCRAYLADATRNPHCAFVHADLTHEDAVYEALPDFAASDRPEKFWHLAANSDIRAGVEDPEIDLRRTFLSTYHALRICRRLGVPDFIFASTSAVYGEHSGPLREADGALLPISSYGAMKLAGEAAISAAVESYLHRGVIMRFPNIVGSRATHGVIPDLVRKAMDGPDALEVLGDGQQRKPYLHVTDLIDAMLFVADAARDRRYVVNIGPEGAGTLIADIARWVVEECAPGLPVRFTGGDRGWPGDVPRFSYSLERIKALGWRPARSSDQAVRLAIRQVVRELSR